MEQELEIYRVNYSPLYDRIYSDNKLDLNFFTIPLGTHEGILKDASQTNMRLANCLPRPQWMEIKSIEFDPVLIPGCYWEFIIGSYIYATGFKNCEFSEPVVITEQRNFVIRLVKPQPLTWITCYLRGDWFGRA